MTKCKYKLAIRKECQNMSVLSLDEWRKRLAERSASDRQSKANTKSDETGPTLTEGEAAGIAMVYHVLEAAKLKPYTTKSDFARTFATEIALAACEGLLSPRLNDAQFTKVWMVTSDGLDWMSGVEDVLRD